MAAVWELLFLKIKRGRSFPPGEILYSACRKIRANAPLWHYLQRALGIPAFSPSWPPPLGTQK